MLLGYEEGIGEGQGLYSSLINHQSPEYKAVARSLAPSPVPIVHNGEQLLDAARVFLHDVSGAKVDDRVVQQSANAAASSFRRSSCFLLWYLLLPLQLR